MKLRLPGAKTLTSIAISVALLAAILSLGELEGYRDALLSADAVLLIVAFSLLPAAQYLRAWRLSIFLRLEGGPPSFLLYRTVSLHLFFSAMLPARVGELSLPLMLKQSHQLSLAQGLGILLLLRVYDLLLVLLIGGVAVYIAYPAGGALDALRWAGLAAALAVPPVALFLPRLGSAVILAAARLLPAGSRFSAMAGNLALATRSVHGFRQVGALLATSAAIWIVLYAVYHLCATALEASPSLAVSIVAGSAATLSALQPIYGVAGIGVVEAAWVVALRSLGTAWELAVVSGVLMHAVQIVAMSVNALVCYLLPTPPPPRSAAAGGE